ncbi:unnamed protein product [Clonostachys rosea]|uniref:Heterokaryon incompatibility domain-containing protein n=1 Tax=Bionectria ochroleuca TaxID=29856 RepID=A0ABY6US47_BIOOC|nr:unnamed protein product [Clonostachys rosea]
MDQTTFTYKRLESARNIRILRLEHGQVNDEIKCSLEHVSLDGDYPEYEAISYAWGDKTRSCQVVLDGAKCNITASLFSALKHFRKPSEARILWADALCIDQESNGEKTHQVKRMAEIYSSAQRVLVWLGPDAESLENFVPSMSEVINFLLEKYSERERPQQMLAPLTPSQREQVLGFKWKHILPVFDRPWFTRKWVVQELSLAKEAMICYGFRSIPAETLGIGLKMPLKVWGMSNKILDQFLDIRHKINNGLDLLNQYCMRRYTDDDPVGLLDLLCYTSNFQCTEQLDHFYSLLGLVDAKPFEPDYACDFLDLCLRFAQWHLVDQQNGRILSEIDNPKTAGLPSWALNVSKLQKAANLDILKPGSSAGGNDSSEFKLSSDGNILMFPGKIIDTIINYEPIYARVSPLRPLQSPPAEFKPLWALYCHQTDSNSFGVQLYVTWTLDVVWRVPVRL